MEENRTQNPVVPAGYITGMYRTEKREKRKTHLYHGDFDNPGLPMCQQGWNAGPYSYSIFRGVVSRAGICKSCLSRAVAGLPGYGYDSKTTLKAPKNNSDAWRHGKVHMINNL